MSYVGITTNYTDYHRLHRNNNEVISNNQPSIKKRRSTILCGCRSDGLLFWHTRSGCGWAAEDDNARGALGHRGFGLGRGLVFHIVDSGKIIRDLEQIGLLDAKAAGNTADGALRARYFACFPVAAGDGHHILTAKGRHFDNVSRAGAGTSPAAGAFGVIDYDKAVDYAKGVELAGEDAVAEAQAAEFARLNVGEGIGREARWDTLISSVEGLVFTAGTAVNYGLFKGSHIADFNIKRLGDYLGGFGAAGRAFAYQLGLFQKDFGVFHTAGEPAGTAVDVGQNLINHLDTRVGRYFEFDAGDKQRNRETQSEDQHCNSRRPRGGP